MSFRDPDHESWTPLVQAATHVMQRAYAPYSQYLVGAALACDDGSIVVGCNVENASYGATICAERNAIWHAVATDRRVFTACVVVTRGPEPAYPCGMCRQVMIEFARDLPILLVAHQGGKRILVSLEQIVPGAFRPEALTRG